MSSNVVSPHFMAVAQVGTWNEDTLYFDVRYVENSGAHGVARVKLFLIFKLRSCISSPSSSLPWSVCSKKLIVSS